jgi:plasmid maintenance system antidote protein VapI
MNKSNVQEQFKVKPLQTKSSALVSIIKNNDVLNVSGLERTLSIPKGTISKAMNGKRLIPEKYIFILSKYLSKF